MKTNHALKYQHKEDAPHDGLGEIKRLHSELMGTVTQFRSTVDAELKELKRGQADVIREAQFKTMNDAIDAQQKLLDNAIAEFRRPRADNDDNRTDDQKNYNKAFEQYLRRGLNPSVDLNGLAEKSYGVEQYKTIMQGSNPDGGYVTSVELDGEIMRVARKIIPFRSLATVRQIGGTAFEKIVNLGGAGYGWVGETTSRSETSTPTLDVLRFSVGELYAEPRATQTILDDANINIEQWIADEVMISFAEAENIAYVSGNGVAGKPKGVLSYNFTEETGSTVAAWGNLGYIKTGGATDFASSNPADAIKDVVTALKTQYLAGAQWQLHRRTKGKLRKFKDGQGQYIWQPGLQAGDPATIDSYSYIENDDWPEAGANNYLMGFANWSQLYLILDRVGTRVLRDPFTSKPYVKYYTTKRVGGGVQNFEAGKFLRCVA